MTKSLECLLDHENMNQPTDNTPSSIQVRRATPADAAEIITGIRQICREGGAFITDDYVPTLDWETALHHPDQAADRLLLVVAELNGRIVGVGRLFAGASKTRFQHVADLGIFVLKPYRREGVAQKIIETLLDWARDKKLHKVTLEVLASNKPAQALFSKCGFKEEGRLRDQICDEDGYMDLLQMALFLDEETEGGYGA